MSRHSLRASVWLAAFLPLACTRSPPASSEQLPAEIREASGVTRSARDPSMLWVHGDSGTPATVYAIDGQSQILARVRLEGVDNHDWEDITIANGKLVVGDIGNNSQARQDLELFVFDEPDPRGGDQVVDTITKIPWRFGDQAQFPAARENFDAEALFWARDQLFLLSKHRADTQTTLYAVGPVDAPAKAPAKALTPAEFFDVGGADKKYGGMVTAAEATPDGQRLAVLTYHALFVFPLAATGPLLAQTPTRVEFDMSVLGQCEAVTWDGDTVVVINEDGRVFRIAASTWQRGGRFPAG